MTVCVPNSNHSVITQTPSVQYSKLPHDLKQLRPGNCCLVFPLLLTNINTLETKGKHQTTFYTLSKGYTHIVGENTDIVNKGIQPHTTYSLYDSDTWSIGQSGFHVEVSHHHGLGEQYFIQST